MAARAFLTFNPELEMSSSAAADMKSLLEDFSDSDDVLPNAVAAGGGAADADAIAQMPLQNEWRIWEQIEADSQRDYTDNMKAIFTFRTVQEFWQLWNVLPQPSQLMSSKRMVREGSDGKLQMVDGLMVFRDNIKPMWEDPLNSNGGHFEIRYGIAKDTEDKARLDEHWNNLVLGMIGSTIEPVGMITGVRLVDKLHASGRPGSGFVRIEIWFTDTGFPDSRQKLRNNIEKAMATRLKYEYYCIFCSLRMARATPKPELTLL